MLLLVARYCDLALGLIQFGRMSGRVDRFGFLFAKIVARKYPIHRRGVGCRGVGGLVSRAGLRLSFMEIQVGERRLAAAASQDLLIVITF